MEEQPSAEAEYKRGALRGQFPAAHDDTVRGCVVLHLHTGTKLVDSGPGVLFAHSKLQLANHAGKGAVRDGKGMPLRKNLADPYHIPPAPLEDLRQIGQCPLPPGRLSALFIVIAAKDLADGVPGYLESQADLADSHPLAVKGLDRLLQVVCDHLRSLSSRRLS